MATTFGVNGPAGSILYALIYNTDQAVWDNVNSVWATYNATDIANYAISMQASSPTSPRFVGTFPTTISDAGTYICDAFIQEGSEPNAAIDELLGEGEISWGGSVPPNPVVQNRDLVSLDFVREFLGNPDHSADALLSDLIEAVSDTIRSYCHREFLVYPYSEYLNGTNDFQIQVKNIPVLSVSQITFQPYSSNPQVITASNIIFDSGTGQMQVNPNANTMVQFFYEGFKNVLVDYSAGYPEIPNDLQLAVCLMVKLLFLQSGYTSDSQLPISEQIGDYKAEYASMQQIIDRDLGVRAILDRYKEWL